MSCKILDLCHDWNRQYTIHLSRMTYHISSELLANVNWSCWTNMQFVPVMMWLSYFMQTAEYRAASRCAPSQWERFLQSNGVSHWLGPNLESAFECVGLITSGDDCVTARGSSSLWHLAVMLWHIWGQYAECHWYNMEECRRMRSSGGSTQG